MATPSVPHPALSPPLTPTLPGLIWGFDFVGGEALPVTEADLAQGSRAGAFRWLHVNIADQSSCRWIEQLQLLPPSLRELLLSPEPHQRALVDSGFLGCVLHDFQVDFGKDETSRIGALYVAGGAGLMITARHHPLYAADVVRRRIDAGRRPESPAQALDLLVTSIMEVASRTSLGLAASVQASEDALLSDGWEPDPRGLVAVRRKTVQLHRQLSGIKAVLQRLEEDEDLPAELQPTLERLTQRAASLDADVVAVQADLRLLRDELDLQAAQRTNRNLYVLSILSALLLPATLVTGFFGMNTGGLPLAGSHWGTFVAGLLAIGSAGAVYVWLRRQGFLGGK